jgi:hypothetical protein
MTWPPEVFGARLLPAEYPIRAVSYPGPAIVRALQAGRGAVLQLPAQGRSNVDTITANAQAMLDSVPYDRPLVNGYGGYHPAGFRETLALAARLPDPAALAELRERTHPSWVLVRGATASPEQRDAFETLARVGGGLGLRFETRDGADLLFAVID